MSSKNCYCFKNQALKEEFERNLIEVEEDEIIPEEKQTIQHYGYSAMCIICLVDHCCGECLCCDDNNVFDMYYEYKLLRKEYKSRGILEYFDMMETRRILFEHELTKYEKNLELAKLLYVERLKKLKIQVPFTLDVLKKIRKN